MRTKLLIAWSRIATKYPVLIVTCALILAILGGYAASNMKMTMNWSDMLPAKNPKVAEFDRIIKEYTASANSIVVLQGEEKHIKAIADDIAPAIREMKTRVSIEGFVDAMKTLNEEKYHELKIYFENDEIDKIKSFVQSNDEMWLDGDSVLMQDVNRLNYKMEGAEKEFFLNHGFMLTKESYLDDMPDIYRDLSLIPFITHLNDNFEKVYTGDEESLSSIEKENNAVQSLDGIQRWIETAQSYASGEINTDPQAARDMVENFTIGDEYLVSPEKTTLMMIVEPNFQLLDIARVVNHVDSLQRILDTGMKKYPDVTGGLTGSFPLNRDEMVYSERDMQTTGLLGIVLILILFIASFRMLTAPLFAVINLIMGILWTIGLASIFLEGLNMMTSMFGVILIGLGIDFSVHILSIYNEHRHDGVSVPDSIRGTLLKSGTGVITGGFTTACAFLTLMISEMKAFREMGIILGIGIIATMLASVLVFPAILVLRERLLAKFRKREKKTHSLHVPILGSSAVAFNRKPLLYLVIGLAITGLFLFYALQAKFDYNYLNSEPKGLPSVTLQDSLVEAFNMVSDLALVTAEDPARARKIAEEARSLSTVGYVESLTDFLPSEAQQQTRRPYIKQIREYLTENSSIITIDDSNYDELIMQIERLDMNIYELGQMAFLGGQDRVDRKVKSIIGDPEDPESRGMIIGLLTYLENNKQSAIPRLNRFQQDYEPHLRQMSRNMANPEPIRLDDIPDEIKNRYYNRDHTRMLVSIYPKHNIWNLQSLERVNYQMHQLDPNITGLPIMFKEIVDFVARDGKIATVLTVIVVFLLLLIDFRSLKYALMGLVPLVGGVIWMVGIMHLVGMKFTMVNVMAIPMIIGIGIDDAVHFIHRYRIEGNNSGIRKTALSTGKAIMLTSLTTMAGFGSLMIAKYRGLAHMGSLLFIGVGACFFTTMIFLPTILGFFKKEK